MTSKEPFKRPAGKNSGPRVNEQIRANQVRLIGDDGKQYGVVTIEQAKLIAQDVGMDMVEVSPTASPPVVKLIDFGKYKYQEQKKISEAKKKQVVIQIKEIKFRPNIEKHDLEVKIKKAAEFLEDADKVKLVMQFRGREMEHMHLGLQKFQEIIQSILDIGGVLESSAKTMGNRVFAMIGPKPHAVKKK